MQPKQKKHAAQGHERGFNDRDDMHALNRFEAFLDSQNHIMHFFQAFETKLNQQV